MPTLQMSAFDQRYLIFFTHYIIVGLQICIRRRRPGVYSALQCCCCSFFYPFLTGGWCYIFDHNYLCIPVLHISAFQCTKLTSRNVACAIALKFFLSASHLWNLHVQYQIIFSAFGKPKDTDEQDKRGVVSFKLWPHVCFLLPLK